jgi:predicted nucleic acid-binding protein
MSQPAYPGALRSADVAERLAAAVSGRGHQFWPDDVNLLDPDTVDWRRILGHRQVTDTYLLALAVRHGGRFVTFDRRISSEAVIGAQNEHLAILDA